MASKDKAYIVVNEQQEHEVLEKLERKGLVWSISNEKPTKQMPSSSSSSFIGFPYVLFKRNRISWGFIGNVSDEEIVFDGRKEEHMSNKYVVSQEFMNELEEWKDTLRTAFKPGLFVGNISMETFPNVITDWWVVGITDEESNNRLIAILRWVNGEDVFEVEKSKKWVVRSKLTDRDSDYGYVEIPSYNVQATVYCVELATKFDTKEEAESWANAHQEVVEVEV